MSVGVEVIDNDHKKLMSFISTLSDAIEEGETGDVIEGIFDDLAEYVTTHFEREEELMRQCDFHDYENHIKQHRKFAERVPELKRRLLSSGSIEVALEINIFLYQWLINHILNDDMSYAQSVFEHGMTDVKRQHDSAVYNMTEKMGRRITLSWRMLLTSLIPITAIMGLAWVVFSSDYQKYITLNKLQNINVVIQEINHVTHNLQAERGLTTGYISSDYSQFGKELDKQRLAADQSIKNMMKAVEQLPDYLVDGNIMVQKKRIEELPFELELLRNEINQHTKELHSMKAAYTQRISGLLALLENMTYLEIDSELSSSIRSTVAILNLKESIGQERALGTQCIEKGCLTFEEVHLFASLIDRQKSFLESFHISANVNQKTMWHQYNSGDTGENVKKAEKAMLNEIISNRMPEMDSHQWFKIMSERMDQLEEFANHLVIEVQVLADKKINDLRLHFYTTSAILVFIIVFTLALSWIFNRSIILPVQKITKALNALADGDRDFRFTQSPGNDELGEMIDAYEKSRRALLQADVAANIRHSRKDIDLLHQTREKTVYEEQASVDPLTGALNRRKFDELAKNEIERVLRRHHRISIMFLDIDHFKRVNDTYGHAIGDIVLQKFFQACQKVARETDILSRFGGEEFLILLPETNLNSAARIAERIREFISKLVISVDGNDISITVSIGVTEWHKKNTSSLDELIQQADKALYQAKTSGRNRVVLLEAS